MLKDIIPVQIVEGGIKKLQKEMDTLESRLKMLTDRTKEMIPLGEKRANALRGLADVIYKTFSSTFVQFVCNI